MNKQILDEGYESQMEISSIVPFITSNEKLINFSLLHFVNGGTTVLSPEEVARRVKTVVIPDQEEVVEPTESESKPEEPVAEPVVGERTEEVKENSAAPRIQDRRSTSHLKPAKK